MSDSVQDSGKQTGNKQGKRIGKGVPPDETKFKPGQSGNPAGRPPKLIQHITQELKEQGYEPVKEAQIVEAYTAILQLPEKKIKEIEKDATKPYFLRLVARWMQSTRGMEILDRIMDRSFGKVMLRQAIKADITSEQPLFPDIIPAIISNPEQEGKE